MVIGKLEMSKSFVRLKKMDKIPITLIGELCSKMTVSMLIFTRKINLINRF